MDIARWLQGIGLEQYEAAFRENEIDGEVLPKLTAEDLKDIGVAIVGHRRKILSAIAELSNSSAAAAIPQPAAEPETATAVAERRQLTVMFCDLVDSTALSARMDPEDLREVITAYQKLVSVTVRRFDGFVAKYMGDGVLVYFGYPQAHEHDAEDAVRAGLSIVDAAPRLVTSAGASLHVRVGIATGIVVVGDLLGSGEAQERVVVGGTPNLAARLQGIAEPDSVVIAEGTRNLLGNLFEFVDLGAKDLKGIAGRTQVYLALRSSSQESRFEALHPGGLTPLIGREAESELLFRLWAKAKAGRGQVALLSGEAGIGKSRLTADFLERLAGEPHVRMRYFCSPHHTDSALYPIISHMARAAELTREDNAKTKLDKLDTLLAASGASRQDATLLAEMLSLANDGRYPSIELAPQQRREKTMEALISQVEAMSRQSPVLMIFEDAHWADPSSLEVLGRLVDQIEDLRILLFVTFRPEFAAPWIGRPFITALTINRLAQEQVIALIEGVIGDRPLADNARQDIVERADGIPLFVEEMTKAVLESDAAAARTIASIPSPALAVPASLHASLMARLDRLESAKSVAQIGAAIGREFSHALLALVAGLSEPELHLALDRLLQSGLLLRQGAPPHTTYLFKHALVQDAAYGTLLREPRRMLHGRIAEVLESQFADMNESQPELLARHCAEAGLIEKAAVLWGKAGQRSLARSALIEAIEQLTRALDLIARLPGTPASRQEQIKLQVTLITPLIHVKGHAAPEPKEAAERALLLIEQAEKRGEPPDDPLLLFSVLYGFCTASLVAFNGDALRERAAQFLALAEKQTATAPRMIGHRLVGNSLLYTGDFANARGNYDQAIALYDPAQHRPLATRFGQDARVSALSFRSWAQWLLGHPAAALSDSEQALSESREIGHAATLMNTLSLTSFTHSFLGDHATASARADESAALADEKGALAWKALAMFAQGLPLSSTGKAAESVRTITSAIAIWRSTGSTLFVPLYQSYLAMAYAQLGQFDEAWSSLGQAMTAMKANKESWWEAEVHRACGEIALMSDEPDAAKAEAYFERARTVARAQQANSLQLRAVMSLARLWRDQGKRDQARNLVAPVYGSFIDGLDTLDLKEAKVLLDTLA